LKILFVCSGNICRSPMAEAILRRRIREGSLEAIETGSAGTLQLEGEPADGRATAVARASGYDLSAHRSRGLTRGLLLDADLVAVMEREHLEEATLLAPGHTGIHLLSEFLGAADPAREEGEIPDPIGGDEEEFRNCLSLLERCVDGLMGALAGAREGPLRRTPGARDEGSPAPGEGEKEYFGRIEERLARARRGVSTLTSLEFHIADRWWQSSVPLWLVLEAMERTSALWPEGEAPRSFLRHVEKDVAISLSSFPGAAEREGAGGIAGACAALRQRLERALEDLGEECAPLKEAILASLQRLDPAPPTIAFLERELNATTLSIVAAAERCLEPGEAARLRDEASGSLGPMAARLPAASLPEVLDRIVREKILARYSLPSLSLVDLLPRED